MNYTKLLKISSFFTWHIFLEIGKTQDMPSKIWQTLRDALREQPTIAIFAGPWLMFGVFSFWTSYSSNQKNYILLAYQPVFLHKLIRINIKIKFIDNNYSYLSHVLFHLLNILTYTQIYIYHYLVAINFILHHTSMCIWYIFNLTIVCELVLLSPSSYMNTWWHISWVVFYKQ